MLSEIVAEFLPSEVSYRGIKFTFHFTSNKGLLLSQRSKVKMFFTADRPLKIFFSLDICNGRPEGSSLIHHATIWPESDLLAVYS